MIHMSVILPKHTCLSDIQSDDDDDDQSILSAESITLSSYRSSSFPRTDPETSSYPERCCSMWNISLCPAEWSIRVTDREKTHLQSNNQLTETHQNYWQQKIWLQNHWNNNQVYIRYSSSNHFEWLCNVTNEIGNVHAINIYYDLRYN